MPVDTDHTIPVLVHVNPDEWATFKRLCGKRRASMKVRTLIRREIAQAQATKRS